jgi:hypothetical protein
MPVILPESITTLGCPERPAKEIRVPFPADRMKSLADHQRLASSGFKLLI